MNNGEYFIHVLNEACDTDEYCREFDSIHKMREADTSLEWDIVPNEYEIERSVDNNDWYCLLGPFSYEEYLKRRVTLY